MKQFLFTLLLSPFCVHAQLLEANISLGANIHTLSPRGFYLYQGERHRTMPGYAGSISATMKVPGNCRVGLSVSSYRIGYRSQYPGIHPQPEVSNSIKPILFEAIALSRNHFKAFDLDLGVIGGVCMNRTAQTKLIDDDPNKKIAPFKGTWVSYGLLGSCMFGVSKTFALGGEIQPKFISGDMAIRKTIFVLPVCVKGTIRI